MKTNFLILSRPVALMAALLVGAIALPETASAKPDKDKKKSSSSKSKKSSSSKKQHKERHDDDDHRDHDRHDDDDRQQVQMRRENHNDGDHSHARTQYLSRERRTFTLNLGTGYAGRGYYYGPPNAPYYYERPEVQYYRTREAAPREYWSNEYYQGSVEASVQQALSQRGYYQGPIDGELGPYSRRSIARYQADSGLRPTGQVSVSLLRSLGLQ